jgi:hypothetical protein
LLASGIQPRRFLGREEPDKGKGADREGSLIALELYDARSDTSKFVPVLFEARDEPFIPEPISGHAHYLLNSGDNYAKLYAFLTGQAVRKTGKLSRRPLVRTDATDMLKRRLKQTGRPASRGVIFSGRYT